MTEHILFLTGKLAEPSLKDVLAHMAPTPFTYEVRNIGVSVAALMTADLIRRRLTPPVPADRVMVPGRCRGDLEALSQALGVPVVRGPEELKDLPRHFGRGGKPIDLSRHDVRIFAEIVDAPELSVDAIVQRARDHVRDGADVIDLGSLPDTPFPHLEEAVKALKDNGFTVSVDSLNPDDLRRGGLAGADYLLSLSESTLWLADEVASTPILVPETAGDMESLYRAMRAMEAKNRAYLADPILDPIHFGFTASVVRYHQLRQDWPEAPIMMGTGNVTELTDADTSGMQAILMGIISELSIGAILTTQVSPHARSVIREADAARRLMYAARADRALPKRYGEMLMGLHSREPFPFSPEEIEALAQGVKDPSFRVQISRAGIHVYNRQGMRLAQDAFTLWPQLHLETDAAHAFYMGVELARAEIAWKLGKRYTQDEPLNFGAALPPINPDLDAWCAPGTTLTGQNDKETS